MKKEQTHWDVLLREGDINTLVNELLPLVDTDSFAAVHFERLFTRRTTLFQLEPQTVGRLQEYADNGSAMARFALGRWHICTMPEADSTEISIGFFEKAAGQGLPAAFTALGQAWEYGDMGLVDLLKAQSFLQKGEDSEFGRRVRLQRLVFGRSPYIRETDPGAALKLADRLIQEDTRKGLSPNPDWYYFKACAIEALEGRYAAEDTYRLAAEAGIASAWLDIALAHDSEGEGDSHDDRPGGRTEEDYGRDHTAEEKEYRLNLAEGCRRNEPCCLFIAAMKDADGWDELPEFSAAIAGRQLIMEYEKAYELGFEYAAKAIGDIYFYGHYAQKQDMQKAWEWYAKAALLRSPDAYEEMFYMVHRHLIDKDADYESMLALYGTRAGSMKLLARTVFAYQEGRLTEYAAEIEQYYIPLFDSDEYAYYREDEDPDDDEYDYYSDDQLPDDDGRFDAYS